MRLLLFPISLVYCFIMWVRNLCFDFGIFKQYSFDIPIVSVGNITTGGTGKTPMVIAIAKHYLQQGKQPVIISRGYGRKSKGLQIVHDGNLVLVSPKMGGDEPVMMAHSLKKAPIIVCEKRRLGVEKAIQQFSPDVVILDDAFQHRQIKRDSDIVLINASKPNDLKYIFPAGNLRESIKGLSRATAIAFTKGNPTQMQVIEKLIKEITDVPIFHTKTKTEISQINGDSFTLGNPTEPVFAFCGIGDPTSFKSTLEYNQIEFTGFKAFNDHQKYSHKILNSLENEIKASGSTSIIITEKDLVKLPDEFLNSFKVFVVKIELEYPSFKSEV